MLFGGEPDPLKDGPSQVIIDQEVLDWQLLGRYLRLTGQQRDEAHRPVQSLPPTCLSGPLKQIQEGFWIILQVHLLVESTKVFDNLHLTQQQVQASGFIINPDLPWIGATPDGIVTCTCHGDGVLEIKCPFNSTDYSLTESCKGPSFCLGIGEDGT